MLHRRRGSCAKITDELLADADAAAVYKRRMRDARVLCWLGYIIHRSLFGFLVY